MPRLLITALVLASLSPDAGAQAPDASPQKGTGVLMGQVVDAFGRGVGDAVVTLSGGFSAVGASTLAAPLAGGPRRTITTGSGQFVFFDLPAGAYSLEATKPGFLPGAYGRRRHGGQAQSVRLADGERQTRLTIQMWEYATIGGGLTDESGEPLPGVTVRALPRVIDSRRPRWESAPSAGRRDTTDDRGEYRLDALPPGDYIVAVVAAEPSAPGVPGGSMTRRAVRHPDDSLIYPTMFHPSAGTIIDAQVITLGSGEERFGVDLQWTPVGSAVVTGTVVWPGAAEGTPIVRLLPGYVGELTNDRDFAIAAARTDAGGRFAFPGVPAGDYILRGIVASQGGPGVDRPAPLSGTVPLTVGGGGAPDVVLPLSAGVTVTGRVVFDGALPKPDRATMQRFGIRLEATDAAADRSPTLQTASVDAAGHFVIRGVPAGRYVVKFQATAEDRRAMDGWESVGATLDGVDVSTRPMDVHSDVKDIVLTLSDRAGRLTGTVRDASGAPDPNASVLLFTTDREIWVDSGVTNRRIRSVRAGEDGTFVIPVVHGGEYFLTAIPDDDVDGWDDPRVMEAIARTAMRIRFRDFERKTVDVTTRSVRQERGR